MPIPLSRILLAASMLLGSAITFVVPAFVTWPVWVGQLPGLILFVASGSTFAAIAFDMKKAAHPREIVEIHSIVVTDESVPEGFQK